VADFMPLFIEAGFDIINPVQLSAAGMDAKMLKREYGGDLVFWGGVIDTQKTLPFGTPEEVKSEATERCEILAEGGGFVFNAIHNVQARTPMENLRALLDVIKDFR
jgi:uroporphyrinogen-III decarboxylase